MSSAVSASDRILTFFLPFPDGSKRRIQVLLPLTYYLLKDKHFSVMYLQDGQNLFGKGEGFGTWALDSTFTKSSVYYNNELILVGIDHAGVHRIREFTPPFQLTGQDAPVFQYLHFLVNTVKPFIDQHFKTIPNRNSTGIGGSSMGALVSLYALFNFPHIFSKCFLFSPSLWIVPSVYNWIYSRTVTHPVSIYVYAGERESAFMISHCHKLVSTLSQKHLFKVKWVKRKAARHKEIYWGKHFPFAARWLFG
jgi:predicted alpha/beta superfamily hydrolase